MHTTKSCSRCKEQKEIIEFSFRNKAANIRNNVCKLCHKNYTKEHYVNNKVKYITCARQNTLKYRQKIKLFIISVLKDKCCIDCGETDIRTLDFDHGNPTEKKYAISKMIQNFSWKQINAEIEKCDIRCANCHRIRTSGQLNWFKSLLS